MRRPLYALTAAAFGIGTSEYVIVGLLPQLATGFRVSIPKAGVLVTAYALSVTFGSPVLSLAMGRTDRRSALLWLMGLFTAGNALCALAPDFNLLLAARVLTALCHGAFFGIASVLAASLVPREQRARAITLMFAGLTLANILGVPAGTALGLRFGWRSTFAVLVPVGLAVAGLLVWWVPRQVAEEPLPLRHELHAVLRPAVLLVMAMSTVSSTALFCTLTYISPLLATVTHLQPGTIAEVLMVFGVGLTIGTLLGGWLSDWRQMTTILAGYAVLTVIFAAMPSLLPYRIPAILAVFLWGLVHFAAGAPMQPRTVEKAGGANLASALNQSAFNLGNALGASLGGVLLTRGASYRVLPYWSAGVALCTLALAGVALLQQRQESRSALEEAAA